jgi:hypothetical protein
MTRLRKMTKPQRAVYQALRLLGGEMIVNHDWSGSHATVTA